MTAIEKEVINDEKPSKKEEKVVGTQRAASINPDFVGGFASKLP